MPGPLPASRAPGALTVDPALVDAAAAFVERTFISHSRQAALEIGRYLKLHFFADDPALVDALGQRHASLAALALRRGGGLTRWYLWSALTYVTQLDQLPPAATAVLPISHYRQLHTVKDSRLKSRLALKAARERWTYDELTKQVRALRPDANRPGPKPDPPVVAFLKKVSRATRGFGVADVDRAALAGMGVEDRVAAAKKLERQAGKLMKIAAVVRGDVVDGGGVG